ncbi:SpcZ [Streptomyces lasiicapitis]|nr:SpcZ [Streptomyces lasiicapitis]
MGRTGVVAESLDEFVTRLAAGPVGPAVPDGSVRPERADGGSDGSPAGGAGSSMPSWLAQVAAALYCGQGGDAANVWARQMYDGLVRLGGQVPIDVVHDWHVRTVAPMLVQTSVRRGLDGAAQEAARRLHEKALEGERVEERAWREALGAALGELYRYAYAYADAYTTASVNARAYAMDNDYGEEKAAEFATMYAKLNTDANARSYADANALANARALAAAFAAGDEQAFAEAYPFAYAHACALAHAQPNEGQAQEQDAQETRDGADVRAEQYRSACGRLGQGLAESVGRAAG